MKFWSACGDYCSFLGRWFRVGWQMAVGIMKLSNTKPPRITFFGGSRIQEDNEYTQKAFALAAKLAADNIAVITGGGLGLMKAANCGALSVNSDAANIGITVKGLEKKELKNTCSRDLIVTEYFFARKWLLMNYSTGFVVFPGGFGTVDEFAEIMTLFQTEKLPSVPVILFGKEYWKFFIKWYQESAVAHGLIPQTDIELITVTDDIDEAYKILKESCKGECLIEG